MPRLMVPGRLYPVCCATDMSAEAKDRFLQVNNDYLDCGETPFVFVDSLTGAYDKEDEIDENTASSPTSPFKGKSPEECSLLLQQMRRAGADINHEEFIIFDQRSLQDDTVLVVVKEIFTEGEEAWDYAVRMVSEIVISRLLVWTSGKFDVREACIMSERHDNGVLRPDDLQLTREEEERIYEPSWNSHMNGTSTGHAVR